MNRNILTLCLIIITFFTSYSQEENIHSITDQSFEIAMLNSENCNWDNSRIFIYENSIAKIYYSESDIDEKRNYNNGNNTKIKQELVLKDDRDTVTLWRLSEENSNLLAELILEGKVKIYNKKNKEFVTKVYFRLVKYDIIIYRFFYFENQPSFFVQYVRKASEKDDQLYEIKNPDIDDEIEMSTE